MILAPNDTTSTAKPTYSTGADSVAQPINRTAIPARLAILVHFHHVRSDRASIDSLLLIPALGPGEVGQSKDRSTSECRGDQDLL